MAPLLVGVATGGQLKNYLVEVWPAEPAGWDIFYVNPDLGDVEFNSYGETWALVLAYVGQYRVRWHGGTVWDDPRHSQTLLEMPQHLVDDNSTVEVRVVEPRPGSEPAEVRFRSDGGVEMVGARLTADAGAVGVQVASGVEIAFGQPSGHLVGVDTWDGFADVVEARFLRDLRDLPVEHHDVLVTAQPTVGGRVIEVSDAPALVDLDAGVWWTRSAGDGPLVRVGKNIYLSTGGRGLDGLGLLVTFAPGALAEAVAGSRRPRERDGFVRVLRGLWDRAGRRPRGL